jgi:hypothetical protein
MQAFDSAAAGWFSPWADVLLPFSAIALLIVLAVLWYVREGRKEAHEQIVAKNDFGRPEEFRGSMLVQEYRPSEYLRLAKSTTSARLLQFYYHWIGRVRPQAKFDDVAFNAPWNVIELSKEDESITINFSEIAATRRREGAEQELVSIWHIELIAREAKPIPLAASKMGDRRMMFEPAAVLAKAASRILARPVHGFVPRNVWTAGWPLENLDALSEVE